MNPLIALLLVILVSPFVIPASAQVPQIISYPIAGLATAGTVFQNAPATVQGAFGGSTGTLNFTVLNTFSDNLGSYAGDGIDDAWQVQYFGPPPNANAGPDVDFSRTGQTNFFKYVAGLNPLDPNAVFTVKIIPVTGLSTVKQLVFTPLVAGRSYTVKFRPDLAAGTWISLTGAFQSDSGATRTVTDLNATEDMKYYRVEITKP